MNILFINSLPFNPSLGGIERVTDLLAKSLIKKKHNIYYLSGYVDNPQMLEYDFPVPMHTLPEKGLFSSSINYDYYKRFVTENKIEIIINQRGMEINFKKPLEIKQVKKISVLHSTPYAYLKAFSKVFHREKYIIGNIKNLIKFCLYPIFLLINKLKSYKILASHYKYISKNSDAIVLLSNQYIKELFDFNINKNIPYYNIPNPNTYPIQPIDWNKKEKILLFIGRLEARDKNPIRLLKIWKVLHDKYSDWKLIFVGDGSELQRMQTFIKRHKIVNVSFEGKQTDVLKYYYKASFICLTSNYEGWPMALIEGMATGCIPFAFDSFKAVTDIIDDGINGHIINSFNIKEYAKKLSILMENKNKRIQMANNAQEKVKDFDINNIICKWENIINNI